MAFPNEVRTQRLDPVGVSNFTTEFEDKVKIIGKVKGKAEFFNGELIGASKAKRFSECQGPYYSYGSKNYNCTIGFDDLKMNYDGKLKYGKMPKVNIKAKSEVTSTLFSVEVSQPGMMNYPMVKSFMPQKIGQLQAKFTGLGPLNKFTKFLEDGFKSHAQAVILNSMIEKVQYTLGVVVAKVPLPM